MNKPQIVNVINFVRGCEPRQDVDLYLPAAEEISLMKKHHLRGTFLLQYDAMLREDFVSLFRGIDPGQIELGIWHEIVEPLTAACGIPWTGRFPWDWHVHCGFSAGYPLEQREALADESFRKFRELFGYYPKVFGSWLLDSHTVRYVSDKYRTDAMCICKEQYGTDGYTLWGGFYGQGYYPGRVNHFMPAKTAESGLSTPIFRMLGSDPVYQYDCGVDAATGNGAQGVITLEPVYCGSDGGGGVPRWVDWYLKENFNGDCLSFGYAQVGQENSFGWDRIGPGLSYQCAALEKLQSKGRVICETLGETGRRFKRLYPVTPACAITAHTAFDDAEKNSVWYCSACYRINIYCDHGRYRIRDLHVFDDRIADPFEYDTVKANDAVLETLPIADGNRHSGNGCLAGAVITSAESGDLIPGGPVAFTEKDSQTAVLTHGSIRTILEPNRISVLCPEEFDLEYRFGKAADHMPKLLGITQTRLTLGFMGARYGLQLSKGRFLSPTLIRSEKGAVCAEVFCE